MELKNTFRINQKEQELHFFLHKLFAITGRFCTFAQTIYKLKKKKKYEYIDEYLLNRYSKSRFSFTFEELKDTFNSSKRVIHKITFQSKANNKIAIIQTFFYISTTSKYPKKGNLPIYFYIDYLMKYLRRNYYVNLCFNIVLHKKTQQQHVEYQIIAAQEPIRNFTIGNIKHNFSTCPKWGQKTPLIKNSLQRLTALNFISFNEKIG